MSRFIESICLLDGKIRNIDIHQSRMNHTRYKLFGISDEVDLEKKIISQKFPATGKYKCRIVYDEEIESIEFIPYKVKPITSIRLVQNDDIEYRYKFFDRNIFELLKDNIAEDEILIVKNGHITDTSYSNVVFFDGENWITPSSYLLNGTMRQKLLKAGKIIEDEINKEDLKRFSSFKLINAMMDLDESPELNISIIY